MRDVIRSQFFDYDVLYVHLIRTISQNVRLLFQAICCAHDILPNHCSFIFHQFPCTLIVAGKLEIWVTCGRKDRKWEL